MRRYVLPTLLAALAGGCAEPADIDRHTFACRTHAECGSGAFCDEGSCRLFGAPRDVAVPSDTTDTGESAPDAVVEACRVDLSASRFADGAELTLERDPDGTTYLRIRVDGIDVHYPVPDDVVGFDDTASRCCEDACCQLLGPPP